MPGQSRLPFGTVRPFSPASNNIPRGRRVSVTEIVDKEDPDMYAALSAYVNGGVYSLDRSMISARGNQEDLLQSTTVGRTTPMVLPGHVMFE